MRKFILCIVSVFILFIPCVSVYASDTNGGIYVYGEWVYYASPSVTATNVGAMVGGVEFFRTKTDGTVTKVVTPYTGS